MRGRAISLILFLLSLSQPALPACSWTPRYSAAFRATVHDVAVDSEGFIWIATGYGIQLLEPRAGGGLSFVDSEAIPGSTRVLALSGNLAYAGSGSRIYVLRRSGRTLEVVRSIDAGATVNDIVVTSYLFAATSNGIAHFDLVDPTNPFRTSVILDTSRPDVTSLALAGSTMYAADGDLTVEVFSLSSPAFPQKTTTLESLTRSSSVHATSSNGFLLVSDDLGQNTDVFIGNARYTRVPYGSIAAALLTTNSVFVAGPDRSVRALDLLEANRVAERFEQQLAPTGGTSNRIFAMARSGNFLYVAAGDIGLVVFDVSELAVPHPLVSYADGSRTSARIVGNKAFYTDAAGTIFELAINPSGISMTPTRSWSAGAGAILRDIGTTAIVSSRDSTVTMWPFEPPTTVFTATFAGTVASAVIGNGGIVALLADGSVWTAATNGTAPQKANLGNAKMTFLARDGAAIALAEVTDAAKTVIRYYANGDLAAAPRTFNLDGAAIGGIALNATHAAIFTFSGINVVNLAGGSVSVLAESNRFIPKQLLFANNDLLVLGDRTLTVWNAASGALQREHTLPANSVAMHAGTALAVIASTEGSMAIDYTALLPKGIAAIANSYYEEAVAAGDYLDLFDDGRIDIHWTGKGAAPRFVSSVDASGAIDIAALPQSFYALGANNTVTAYSTAGAQTAQITINEAQDAQPLSITTAGNAVWVSIAKGCLSGTCERKTLVLDPKTLAVTMSMNGGVVDVATSGPRAYALFSLPDETRVLNIENPLQPSQLASTPSPPSSSAIGAAFGLVYVVAEKVHAYSDSLLALGQFLPPVTSPEQRLAIDGDCAIITGRGANPELYTLPDWTAASSFEVPSPVQTIAAQSGRLFVLTEHSIEVWTTATPPAPPKRRAAR